jgi:hypothetical protein
MIFRHVKSSKTVLAVSANQRAAALAIAVDGMWEKPPSTSRAVLTPPIPRLKQLILFHDVWTVK